MERYKFSLAKNQHNWACGQLKENGSCIPISFCSLISWVSVEDFGLPNEFGQYVFQDATGDISITNFDEHHYANGNNLGFDKIVAWSFMPLPFSK